MEQSTVKKQIEPLASELDRQMAKLTDAEFRVLSIMLQTMRPIRYRYRLGREVLAKKTRKQLSEINRLLISLQNKNWIQKLKNSTREVGRTITTGDTFELCRDKIELIEEAANDEFAFK